MNSLNFTANPNMKEKNNYPNYKSGVETGRVETGISTWHIFVGCVI